MQLVMLCAGRGSRLPKKFRNKPKCLMLLNNKNLLSYNEKFIKSFKKKIIVTGYRSYLLQKKSKKYNFTYVINQKYKTTNMVHSLFLARKKITSDVVIMYGDIIFDYKIYKLLKTKKNIMPINKKWFENWKKRMGLKKTLNDAENLFLKNNFLKEIGTKIKKKKLPKYQFMGLLKLKKKTYFNLMRFYKKINNDKIDMTSFINLCINNNKLKISVSKSSYFWYEIDTISDFNFAEKELKKNIK